ncbi:MAG TPA: efflux transporter outer membrane subunit [Thermoanaerobaculia bacterium]
MKRLLVITLLLTGCTLGPDYQRPVVTVPDTWRANAPAAAVDLGWWDEFQDPELRELIREALVSSHDLRIAVARVDQARALLGITRSDQLPRVDAGASASRNRFSETTEPRGFGGESNRFAVAADLSFEIDLWGRLRRATEASRAELLATEEARNVVQMTLVSDVAGAYLRLRQLDLELETTRRNATSRRDALQIVRDRFEAGLTSALDLHQAEAGLAATAARIPDLERLIVETENQLSILVGRPPRAIPRGRALNAQTTPPEIPAGLPSDLLERRPDIRLAEAALVAANARIGVAKADYFPRISLTGLFGVESSDLSDLFTSASRIWTYGAGLAQPIFNAGRTRGNVEFAEARQREALIAYEQTIYRSFREVEDALVAHRKAREALAAQNIAVRASREALSVAESRYRSGLTTYLDVLDAQRTLLAAEVEESRTLLTQLVAVVQLYRAIGGGWETESGAATGAAE